MKNTAPRVLPRFEADRLLTILHHHGEKRATELLLVNRVTLLRAAARVPLLPSTLQCVASRLRELFANGANPNAGP